MNLASIKKIEFLKRRISFRTSAHIALAAVIFLAVAGLVIDIWTFYVYGYKAVNENVTSDYTVGLKRKELTTIIDTLDERKTKFNAILEGNIENVPQPFR